MENFQPSKMSDGLRAYLSKCSQKNKPDDFKEQHIRPLGLAQFLISLSTMGVAVLAFLYADVYVAVAILVVFGMIVLFVTVLWGNTYVKITRRFVETSNVKGQRKEIEYQNVTGYNVYDDGHETGIILHGTTANSGRDNGSVQVSSICANLAYLQAQLTFRILNDRWATAHSEEDQKMLFDYIRSGQAQEVCMSRGGTVFSNPTNTHMQ